MLQVRRLESAIRKENKQSTSDPKTSKKRLRGDDSEMGDSNGSDKIKATDMFRSMGVKQLREEANLRGISASGLKKELIDRLCNADAETNSKDIVIDGNLIASINLKLYIKTYYVLTKLFVCMFSSLYFHRSTKRIPFKFDLS